MRCVKDAKMWQLNITGDKFIGYYKAKIIGGTIHIVSLYFIHFTWETR